MRKHGLICGLFLSILIIGSSAASADPLMFLPFRYGESWYCTQGQGGSYSHQGAQYYGFDFNKGSWSNSTSNPAYGANLYAPISGKVVEIRDGVYDFSNNSSSNASNNWGWGNTIVIRDKAGIYYVRLAHLRYGSLDHLDVGDWLDQGDYIGKVGQTGYSTSPHLHIQIMRSSRGYSQPFTFAEGKLYSYEWIKSSLIRKASMLDNNAEETLSHNFYYGYTVRNGPWYLKTGIDGYAGKNYRSHKVVSYYDPSYYEWRFRVKQSGWYAIYVTWPAKYKNEPKAKYYFDGSYIRTMDQTDSSPFLHYLTTKYMSSSKQYRVRVKGRTANKYLIADAIVLRKL